MIFISRWLYPIMFSYVYVVNCPRINILYKITNLHFIHLLFPFSYFHFRSVILFLANCIWIIELHEGSEISTLRINLYMFHQFKPLIWKNNNPKAKHTHNTTSIHCIHSFISNFLSFFNPFIKISEARCGKISFSLEQITATKHKNIHKRGGRKNGVWVFLKEVFGKWSFGI